MVCLILKINLEQSGVLLLIISSRGRLGLEPQGTELWSLLILDRWNDCNCTLWTVCNHFYIFCEDTFVLAVFVFMFVTLNVKI